MILKVTEDHRHRQAYVYIRQSTMNQVRHHPESTQRQCALRDKALALGWSEENVLVLDRDLGLSGAHSIGRDDFKTLVADVSMGRVGAVMALEASRLARSSADWHRLIELCSLTRTLIIDEDGCYDPSEFNDGLLLGLKGTMSQAELHFIRAQDGRQRRFAGRCRGWRGRGGVGGNPAVPGFAPLHGTGSEAASIGPRCGVPSDAGEPSGGPNGRGSRVCLAMRKAPQNAAPTHAGNTVWIAVS